MAIGFTVDVDLKGLTAQVAAEDRILRVAVPRAINAAASTARAETMRQIREIYNIRERAVAKRITIRRANRSNWSATVSIRGRVPNLVNFSARQTKKGVSVQILKSGARKLISRAFIARGRNIADLNAGLEASEAEYTGKLVFMRTPREKGAKKARRLPIFAMTTASVPQMAWKQAVREAVARVSKVRYELELDRQIQFVSAQSAGSE